MDKKSISIIFPGISCVPSGGVKIILQYVNKLIYDGYEITLVYPLSMNFVKSTCLSKLKSIVRWYRYNKTYSVRAWFNLDNRVVEKLVFSPNFRHVPKSDIYMCTSVETSFYLKEYPVDMNRKIYFIQDFENWNVHDETVLKSYHFAMNKIVVSSWLKKIVEKENERCLLVRNSFDFNQFKMTTPIERKNKFQISMLYNNRVDKDMNTGIEAFKIVHKVLPNIKFVLFGVEKKAEKLPEWVTYIYNPDIAEHNKINNESAIYVGCSKSEGWGLTIGEAMMCGQAVVCTDNKGYREMAKDGYNALVSPIKDSKLLADNIILLVTNDALRCKIAANGYQSIKEFKIDQSYFILKSFLNKL